MRKIIIVIFAFLLVGCGIEISGSPTAFTPKNNIPTLVISSDIVGADVLEVIDFAYDKLQGHVGEVPPLPNLVKVEKQERLSEECGEPTYGCFDGGRKIALLDRERKKFCGSAIHEMLHLFFEVKYGNQDSHHSIHEDDWSWVNSGQCEKV